MAVAAIFFLAGVAAYLSVLISGRELIGTPATIVFLVLLISGTIIAVNDL